MGASAENCLGMKDGAAAGGLGTRGVAAERGLPGLLACLFLLTSAVPLPGQETIASDRPGIGSGSFVLGTGTLQVEAGVGVARSDGVDRYSLGQLLVRVGAWNGLELQGQFNSLVFDRGGAESRVGFQDLGLGAKLRVIPTGPGGSSFSLLTTVSFPTGSRLASSREVVPGLAVLADVPVARNLGLSANLGYGGWLASVEDLGTLTLTPTLTLPTSKPMGVFLGYAGFFAESGNQHFLEGGLTWLPDPDLQLDANGGLDPDSGNYFVGVGVATRWIFRE